MPSPFQCRTLPMVEHLEKIPESKKFLNSEAAEQNNCAFCDKSIKFGTVVDNSTIMKYRYWATTEFSV